MEAPLSISARTWEYTGTNLLDVLNCGRRGLRARVSREGREEVRGAECERHESRLWQQHVVGVSPAMVEGISTDDGVEG